MKLIIAIINNDDSVYVQSTLSENGFYATKMATSGGFLKKGNTTFFIGTNDELVDKAVDLIKNHARKRVIQSPALPPNDMGDFFNPVMVDVLVGGATIFVVDIEKFEKL